MKINQRLLMESFLVSILAIVMLCTWKMVQGYFLAQNYVPDMIHNYDSVNYLQTQMSLGLINRSGWIFMTIGLSSLVMLTIAYYVIRLWINNVVKKFREEREPQPR